MRCRLFRNRTLAGATLRFVITAVVALALPPQATAQEVPESIRLAAACAPVPSPAPPDAPRVVGGRDPSPKELYGSRDLVTIDAGTARGIQTGQRYFVRRGMSLPGAHAPRAQDTGGWVSIVAVTEQNSIALVDVACGDIVVGDHLEPYEAPVLPAGVDRTDASGELNFTMMAHVLYGSSGRSTGGAGDFMIADVGQEQGIEAGTRFGIFRDVHRSNQVPLVAVGEAIVVSATADNSLVRLTQTRDAIVGGDLLVPRRPGQSAAAAAPPAPPLQADSEDGPSGPLAEAAPERPPVRDYMFEDVHFEFDRFSLRPEALAILDQAVTALQQDPTLRLQIEGHTCNIGTAEYNLALGDRRASAVRDHLIGRGISEARVTTVSYGEERPRHDNSQEETRRQNRRAVLVMNLQQ